MSDDQITNPNLKISGNCYTKEELGSQNIEPKSGDLKLYKSHDQHGRNAMAGRHTNEGFSGTIRATIWDGSKWRNFKLLSLISDTWFPALKNLPDAYMSVRQKISDCVGIEVFWEDKKYISSKKRQS